MSDHVQTDQKNSFYVRGNPEDVSEKIASLYGIGFSRKFDTANLQKEEVEELLGANPDTLQSVYTVHYLKGCFNEMVRGFALAINHLLGVEAFVFGYLDKPEISQVVPVRIGGKVSPEKMSDLELELVEP